MREICFILTKDDRILRIYTGSSTHIDDSRARWNAIWTYRYDIEEIVHTHPGGMLRFSNEDLTTIEAVESATGIPFNWSIVTDSGYLKRTGLNGEDIVITNEGNAWWLPFLRDLSLLTPTVSENTPRPKTEPILVS